MYDFNEWLQEKDESLYNEVNWKQMGRNVAMGAAMGASAMGGGQAQQPQTQMQQPQAQVQTQQPQVQNIPSDLKQKFDNYSQANNTMTPDQWKQYAGQYGEPKMGSWVPNPQKPGQWIPANGADSVRVQSATEVDKDELTRDDIGLTPYKDGKPISPTNWSYGGSQQSRSQMRPVPGFDNSYTDSQGRLSKSTTTPFDGKGLYDQAMKMRNSR